MKFVAIICLATLCGGSVYAANPNVGSSTSLPFYVGPLQSNLMRVAPAVANSPNQTYVVPATPATTQWGVFDSKQLPILRINSGDTVVFQTLAASDGQVVPGVSTKEILKMQNAVSGRGPHTLTGPVYVEGAAPGDVLQIHINSITPMSFASNDSMPAKGLFPELFPDGQVTYFHIDIQNKKIQFAPGIVLPLAPFPGVMGVERATPGVYSSGPPGQFGGNMDLRELTQGSTLYLPVFVKGGMLWTGDSHAGQGNGEIDLTAIETAFAELSVTINLVKSQDLQWPMVETPTDWITTGYDKDLNKALDIAKAQTLQFIMKDRGLSQTAATQVMYQTWNCPISEVVNGVDGVYCMIPKDPNAVATPLPSVDNDQDFVTVGRDADALNAMKKASMAMLQKVATAKNMSIQQTYILASLAMDCRFAPYVSGDKEVHCMMPKSLWVSSAS